MNQLPPECVQLHMYPGLGLYKWVLWGLQIFEYNGVSCPIEQRPEMVFLTDLTSHLACAVHVSSLALKDVVSSPEEMFGPADGPTPYLRSRIGYHDHFYDLNTWHSWDSCVFLQVTSLFWQTLLREEGDLSAMIGSNGFSFYVAPHRDTTEVLERLLSAPFPGETEWLTAVLDLYALVVAVGHDGQFFNVYARDREAIHLIEPSLQTAIHAIETSKWFQTHQIELAWDDWHGCLLLPENNLPEPP